MAFKPALSYCASLVRSQDYDRYICTLFAPAIVQEPWFALFAFNQEIAAIPDSVSEEMMGFMRYAWWREALDEVFGQGPVRRHPIVEALAETVRRYDLQRAPFDALIAARESAFAGEALQTAAQWERYFQATSSGLLAQCARVAGIEAMQATEALGMAWGFCGMARVFLLQNEQGKAKNMLQQATAQLKNSLPLDRKMLPFKHSVAFYVARMRAGKSCGRESALALIVNLSWNTLRDRFRKAF